MNRYESTREILNPCANIYNYDFNFPDEIESNNLEDYLKSFLKTDLPSYTKEILSDGTLIYLLNLPRTERYTFTPMK